MSHQQKDLRVEPEPEPEPVERKKERGGEQELRERGGEQEWVSEWEREKRYESLTC